MIVGVNMHVNVSRYMVHIMTPATNHPTRPRRRKDLKGHMEVTFPIRILRRVEIN